MTVTTSLASSQAPKKKNWPIYKLFCPLLARSAPCDGDAFRGLATKNSPLCLSANCCQLLPGADGAPVIPLELRGYLSFVSSNSCICSESYCYYEYYEYYVYILMIQY